MCSTEDGYIFDILVKVLQTKKIGEIEIKVYLRMADFTEVGEIISPTVWVMKYANLIFILSTNKQ
jgi:hypothetical protein